MDSRWAIKGTNQQPIMLRRQPNWREERRIAYLRFRFITAEVQLIIVFAEISYT